MGAFSENRGFRGAQARSKIIRGIFILAGLSVVGLLVYVMLSALMPPKYPDVELQGPFTVDG